MSSFSQDDFLASLQACASKPGGSRAEGYAAILDSLFALPRSSLSAEHLVSACSQYLDLTVSDSQSPSGGLVASRNALAAFDEAVKRAAAASKAKARGDAMVDDDDADPSRPAIADPEVHKEVLEVALQKLQPRVLVFEEQASALRLHLADVHESLEDWHAAASVLQGIPLDSGHRSVSDLAKLRIYVRIVRLLLEADDDVAADVYLKRASMVVHSVPGTNIGNTVTGTSTSDQGAAVGQDGSGQTGASSSSAAEELKEGKVLGLQYKLCQARIYDAQRRFAEAAVRFHELSYVTDIDEEERTMMLSAAVTAGILAPAGPHRSRILSTLIRDDRTSSLPQATILSKVFLDQIVRPHEVAAFAELLQPHQKAQLSRTGNEREMLRLEEEAASHEAGTSTSGSTSTSTAAAPALRSGPSTVLDRAMMEHNILASSRLYLSLTLRGLGSLLSLTPTGAETIVRRMINQGRLRAEIDQVEGVLTFLHAPGDEVGSAAGGAGGGEGEGEAAGGAAAAGAAPGGDSAGGAADAAGGTVAGPTAGGGAIDVPSEADALTSLGAGDGLVRRWDAQIARTAGGLEEVCVRIGALRG